MIVLDRLAMSRRHVHAHSDKACPGCPGGVSMHIVTRQGGMSRRRVHAHSDNTGRHVQKECPCSLVPRPSSCAVDPLPQKLSERKAW